MRSPIIALLVSLLMVLPAQAALAQTDAGPPGPTPDASADLADDGVDVARFAALAVDSNGNKQIEAIQLMATVNFSRAGAYEVRLSLGAEDGSWTLISSETARTTSNLAAVSYFEAVFESSKLLRQTMGVALVARVHVVNATTGRLVGEAEQGLGPYDPAELEVPDASTAATVSSVEDPRPLDLDSDGSPDILEVPVRVVVRRAASYTVQLTVASGLVAELATRTFYNTTELAPGEHTVNVWVPGWQVRITMDLSAQVRTGLYESPAVDARVTVRDAPSFESPDLSALFGSGVKAVGLDQDDDGLYDQLGVVASLKVQVEGMYRLTAYLAPAGDWVDTNVTGDALARLLLAVGSRQVLRVAWSRELTAGPAEAMFLFDGRALNAWGHDGAYSLLVVAEGPAYFLWGVLRVRDIGSFDHTEFEASAPPLQFTSGHTDAPLGGAAGGGYDALGVTFNVRVAVAATYTAYGVLLHDAREVAYSKASVALPVGDGSITLKFPGEAIHYAKVDGPLVAQVKVIGGGAEWNDTTFERPMSASHTTRSYSSREFAPKTGEADPRTPVPEEGVDRLVLRTGELVVVVFRDRPEYTFYVASDEGRRAYMRLVVTRLLAVEDTNGDGAPQPGEVAYVSELRALDWDTSDVTVLDDPALGRLVRFEQSALVDLVANDPRAVAEGRPLVAVSGFARLTLRFTLAARDAELPANGGTYVIAGGTELKIDVLIEVLKPVADVDFLTLEQKLLDDRGEYGPVAEGAYGPVTESPDVSPFQDREQLKQRIEFQRGEFAPGFYSWVRRAEATADDGTTMAVAVRAAFVLTKGVMLLYLSYPYDVTTAYILHDPSLGVFGDGLPSLPAAWRAVFDPLVWGLSVVAAAAIVYGMRGGPPRRGRDDEEEDGDATGGAWGGPAVAGGPPPEPPTPPAPPGWPPQTPRQPPPPHAAPPRYHQGAPQPPAGTRQDIVEWEP